MERNGAIRAELIRTFRDDPAWDGFCGLIARTFNERSRHVPSCANREHYALCGQGRIVAGASVIIEGELSVYVTNVAVAPEDRRKGHGRDLMLKLCDRLSPRFAFARLVCEEKNFLFYDSLGFERKPGNSLRLFEMQRKLR